MTSQSAGKLRSDYLRKRKNKQESRVYRQFEIDYGKTLMGASDFGTAHLFACVFLSFHWMIV